MSHSNKPRSIAVFRHFQKDGEEPAYFVSFSEALRMLHEGSATGTGKNDNAIRLSEPSRHWVPVSSGFLGQKVLQFVLGDVAGKVGSVNYPVPASAARTRRMSVAEING